ncbi:hypothetical protein [Algoriphagus formosus]|uniref:hypothetical protein n=1 Tax=Algoriphagus formosus TaxID=2007308 RepID=UPI000C28C353|nr:hypothetical protein [Algoriphagus formosus]
MIDLSLSSIENLKWLPWIGSDFFNLPFNKRLLIVGESHYHDNTPATIDRHNDKTFTRSVIKEFAIDRCYYGTKIFPNLHRALFQSDEFNSASFWNSVSFYNFIQRPMVTNKERPNYTDFYNSWFPFLETTKLLQPKICLFIGTSAANSLERALEHTGYSTPGVIWEEKINNAYAKTSTIQDTEGKEILLIFIKHTSQRFSWSQWNTYLIKKIPHEMNWLAEKVK